MHFSRGIIISLLFYHHLVFSEGSLFVEETLSNEDKILGKFFAEFKLLLEKRNLRHVSILGASDEQIDQTKPLLETFPYFIGRDAKEVCTSREFGMNTLIVYFLVSLEIEYLKEVLTSLFDCKRNRLYLVAEGIAVSRFDAGMVLVLGHRKIGERAIFIDNRRGSLKLYGNEMAADCSLKVVLLVDWIPGVNLERLDDLAGRFFRHECPIPVGTIHHPPWMNIAKDANGVVKIIGGSEGKIISTIAHQLNFNPVIKAFNISRKVKGQIPLQVTSSTATGDTAIGIAEIRPTIRHFELADVTQIYAYTSIVWCVPRTVDWRHDILICEFSWATWVLIGVTFLATFTVERIVRNTHYSNEENANKSESCGTILDLIQLTIGNSIVYQPISFGGRVLLIVYLCYSTIITTAYKTSLSSILTAEGGKSLIFDVEGIIKANLTTAGDIYRLAILEDQIGDNELIPELIKRFVIEPNITKALRQITYEKNLAYLAPLPDLIYHEKLSAKAREPMSIDVLDGQVLTHGIAMVVPKSSYLIDQLNHVILRLVESGLVDYWMKSHTKRDPIYSDLAQSFHQMDIQEQFYKHTFSKFWQAFSFHCTFLISCTVILFGEIIFHKYKFSARLQRFRHSRRSKVRRCTTL